LREGPTLAEIAKATKRQNHSIRGFISGSITKKMGLAVESSKNESWAPYRIGEYLKGMAEIGQPQF
jgi:hypothetical protein